VSQISPTNFKRRLTLALALPLLLMSILAASLIGQVSHLTSVMEWVNHTDRVIAQANHTEKLLVDMETGLRGYLVTGNTEFLEPYQKGSLTIVSAFTTLDRLVSDNRSQLQRLKTLQADSQQWQRYAQQMLSLRKQGGDYQAYGINAQGKKLMDTIRGDMASFITTEERLRDTRTQAVQKTTQQLFFTRTVLSLAVGGILAFFIRRQLLAVAQSYGRALAVAQQQTEALREREAALSRSAQRLAGLHQIDRNILAAESSPSLVRTALSQMRQLVPCQQAFVVLFNFETGTAQVIAGSANGGGYLPEGTMIAIADCACENVLHQETRYVEDIATAHSCPPVLNRLLSEGIRSYISVPLVVEENLIGELNLVATQTAAFAPEHQEIATEVAAQLAIAIQQSQLRQQLLNYTSQLEQHVAERTRELQETNTELEAFTYSVSHDLRAPLRTMQGFTQALQEDYGDRLDSLGQDYARYITEAAVSMDTLISDLLTYSRLSRAEIRIQPIDLSRVIAEGLSQLDAELRERQVQVTVEEPLPQVMAHRITLVQVVTNLLANAIKFVKPDVQPQVRVWAEELGSRESAVGSGERTDYSWAHLGDGEGGEDITPSSPVSLSSPLAPPAPDSRLPTPDSPPQVVRLWIQDNGIGIASEYHERIFRVFERLHGVETYPGTGIGLAIVRKGMERMGGQVGVESQPNQGSRFWIELPKVTS
jgi:signal transduction histidine kinase/CHASE3 domain sensor protein